MQKVSHNPLVELFRVCQFSVYGITSLSRHGQRYSFREILLPSFHFDMTFYICLFFS